MTISTCDKNIPRVDCDNVDCALQGKKCQTARCMLAQEEELHSLIVSVVRLLIELLKK